MKKILAILVAVAMTAFAFVGCSSSNSTISTADGGTVDVSTSTVETDTATVQTPNGTATGTAKYDAVTVTYTDPDGYEKATDTAGMVTYTLEGDTVAQILYVPALETQAAMDAYYDALAADSAQLQEYAQQFATDLQDDFTAEKTTVGDYDAIKITGTIGATSSSGDMGEEVMILVIPMGNQLLTFKAIAPPDVAAQVQADAQAMAESLQSTAS